MLCSFPFFPLSSKHYSNANTFTSLVFITTDNTVNDNTRTCDCKMYYVFKSHTGVFFYKITCSYITFIFYTDINIHVITSQNVSPDVHEENIVSNKIGLSKLMNLNLF